MNFLYTCLKTSQTCEANFSRSIMKWHSACVISLNEANTSGRFWFLAWDRGRIERVDFWFQVSWSLRPVKARTMFQRTRVLLFMVYREQSLKQSGNRFDWKFVSLPPNLCLKKNSTKGFILVRRLHFNQQVPFIGHLQKIIKFIF